jgi:hypothetical protein
VQVVVDCTISAGLSGGEEYGNFFKWAKHFNNYHPEVTDEIFKLKNYHPLRYQTKTYDERVSSLNVLCLQERQFLERYLWLSQLPEFFKPKVLFSVIEDSQAQEEAENMLQGFEIDNQTVRCTDGSALQALIPYVKRLLQLFPEVKENTDHAFSSNEIRNRVYQFETRRYVKRVWESPLECVSECASYREFLESEQKSVLNLRMDKAD